jgi:SWIM zinc finger
MGTRSATAAPGSKPQRHGAGWRVPSASTPGGGYIVQLEPRMRCTCPAWRHGHGQECKHIRAVRQEVTMVG